MVNSSDEPAHIKEALSRLVVELIKREWPQNWGSLLPELNNICGFGEIQTEIVLMIFLRLAEDVITMDSNLQSSRKKEITNELNRLAQELFVFFLETLSTNISSYRVLKNHMENGDTSCKSQASVHLRLAEQTLKTLTGYLDWVKFGVLYAKNYIILQMLCLLLEEESLKIPAAECLLIIVSRKGKYDERTPLLELFSEDAMSVMFSAAQKAVTAEFDERQYLFLKRLCQLLVTLGETQLFHLWNSQNPHEKPPNFKEYLEAMVAFSKHESLTIPHLTNLLWLTFLRNPVISKDETFRSMFPALLEVAKAKLFKVHDPEDDTSPGSIFNKEDFNSEREFTSINGQVRGETMDIIRQVTLEYPVETFLFGANWLLEVATRAVSTSSYAGSACDAKQAKQEWDGLTRYFDAVMSRFFKVDNHQEIIQGQVLFHGGSIGFIELARKCIQALINVESKEPLILASLMDAMHSLFPFLKYSEDLLMDVLRKLFAVVLFNTTGDPKGPWSLDVLHARRHACGAVCRMCKEFGQLLVPVFGAFKEHVQGLFVGELVPIKDRLTLTEALVTVSNKLGSEKQSAFLGELMDPIRKIWLSDKMQSGISSPQNFVTFLGLDQDPTLSFQNEELKQRRFEVMLCAITLMAVVRSCASINIETATNTGLSIGSMPNGTPYVCNPCAPFVLPLLTNLIQLAKCMNSLYDPAVKALMFGDYPAILGMHDLDKSAIYVLQGQVNEKVRGDVVTTFNPIHTSRTLLYHLSDTCYHALGYAGACLTHDFYNISGLPQLLGDSMVKTLVHVPNYRLRFFLRNFMKLFVLHCPGYHLMNVAIPILSPFFSYMVQYLEEQWQIVRQHQAESNVDEDGEDVEHKEIIEDQLVCIVSKDYMEVFTLACVVRKDSNGVTGMEITEEDELRGLDPCNTKLGSLGTLLLRTESVNMQILCTTFQCMTWPDSSICHKASRLAMAFMKEVLVICRESETTLADSVVQQLFYQVLKGLHVNGQGPSETYLIQTGLSMYELLRPQYSSLQQVLLQTNCSLDDLQIFEALCFEGKEVAEKKKREQFRKLVAGIIGKNIADLFRNEIKIKDLPPIAINPTKPEQTEDLTGLMELFDPNKSTEVV
ncbi:exportin-5-like isoform X3 [Acropora palmata]